MFRSQGGVLAAGACLGLCLAACQGPEEFYRGNEGSPGQAGRGPSGAAGSIATTGTAGSSAGGAAGYMVTGTAGASAGGAGGDPSGAAGRGGATGTGGAAGRGGATGTGGAAGRGGTTGTGGAAGRGGTTGTGGSMGNAGRGGTTGSAGRGGRGGTTGAAGATGTAGTGGANSCPAGGRLDCTTAGALELSDGRVVDFSAAQWNSTTSRWCDADGLDGGLSSYAGTLSTAMAVVDTTARNLRLNLDVVGGGYAGGRVNFDSCVDATSFNSVQFTASVTDGSLTGCTWQVQLQTQNQRPTTLTNPAGGTCNATTTTCERYPAATLMAATATATTYTVRFSAFNNPSASAVPTASQIVGLQWQANSSNSGSCEVELRIDNIRFIDQ